jgi:hypothetical protein
MQNGQGKDVGGTLQLIGEQLDKCGLESVAVNLASYGVAGTISTKSGSLTTTSSTPTPAPTPTPTIGSSTLSGNDLSITAYTIKLDAQLPNPCVDQLVVDGTSLPLTALSQATPPSEWQSAKNVEITQCSGTLSGSIHFPQAHLSLNLAGLNALGNVSITATSAYGLPGATPIDLTQSKIAVNASGCLIPATLNKANFGNLSLSIVLNSSPSLNTGAGAISITPGSGSVSNGGGLVLISSPPSGGGGGISLGNGGGGLTTNGSGSGSGSGGITLSSGSNP